MTSNENIENKNIQFNGQEGIVKKGGLNSRPSTPRPAEPPKGQSPNNNVTDKK